MLTKNLLTSGAYLDNFKELPKNVLWSLDRIEKSMRETMKERPDRGDFWVFGYGSLIWNPLLNFAEQQAAKLFGWHRSFCLRLLANRATLDKPGRMLALKSGGRTEGIAFRLTEQVAEEELILLWVREMATGVYRPIWTTISLKDGSEATALVFIAEPTHPFFEADATVAAIAGCIASAEGPLGSNADYVQRLHHALSENGIVDEYVDVLFTELGRQPYELVM
jgi:cation transport protein ChaC